jgi:hypothetical protein
MNPRFEAPGFLVRSAAAKSNKPRRGYLDRRTASGLAVDCWDWPGAIRITKEWACCPAISNVSRTRGWPRSGLSHLTWSETYHALDHLLSGVVRIVSRRRFQVKQKISQSTTNSDRSVGPSQHMDICHSGVVATLPHESGPTNRSTFFLCSIPATKVISRRGPPRSGFARRCFDIR